MTAEELDRIEALANDATPGPWMHGVPGLIASAHGVIAEVPNNANVLFISAARDAIPALVAELRRERCAAQEDFIWCVRMLFVNELVSFDSARNLLQVSTIEMREIVNSWFPSERHEKKCQHGLIDALCLECETQSLKRKLECASERLMFLAGVHSDATSLQWAEEAKP